MAGFDKTRWAEEDFARKYLEGADINVVDRRRLLVILQSFYTHFHGGGVRQNRVLDLGCGDGIIAHELLKIDKSLFEYLYAHLTPGGHFVNIDIILSPTEALESWYMKLWMEWVIEKRTALHLEMSSEDVTRDYKEKEHYSKLDTLARQLNALEELGFKDVDCYYKQGIFTIYGGSRE